MKSLLPSFFFLSLSLPGWKRVWIEVISGFRFQSSIRLRRKGTNKSLASWSSYLYIKRKICDLLILPFFAPFFLFLVHPATVWTMFLSFSLLLFLLPISAVCSDEFKGNGDLRRKRLIWFCCNLLCQGGFLPCYIGDFSMFIRWEETLQGRGILATLFFFIHLHCKVAKREIKIK